MELMMACASHTPLLYFPAHESPGVLGVREALGGLQQRVRAFDPQLVVLFGTDHYGGHQMASMPSFCVGVEATALADVGGFPGKLNVDRALAVAAVDALRNDDIDVAVSYAMDVDHGFSQILHEATGSVDAFPVLPIFVCCLQPPFVPFKRARALGAAVARFLKSTDLERILVLGTGGLSHDPSKLFPAIDDVSEEWKPIHMFGKGQTIVPQQAWIDYQIERHRFGAERLGASTGPLERINIFESWDRDFLDQLSYAPLSTFDDWSPATVIEQGGFGAMEVLTWVAAAQTMEALCGVRPHAIFHQGVREVGVGFAIVEAGPAPASAA